MKEMHAWVVLNRPMVERALAHESTFADELAALRYHELPLRLKRLEKALTDENWAVIREQTGFLLESITRLKCNVIPGLCRLILLECDAAARPLVPVCNLIEFIRILMIELKSLSNQENRFLKLESTI